MNINIRSKLKTKVSTEFIDWEDVYVSFLPRIFHFFCFRVGTPDIAEELTSVTFEKAWSNRINYRQERGYISAWMFGIARKVAADYFRRPQRDISLDGILEIPDPINVEDEVQKQIEFRHLVSVCSHLSERERELLALKYGAELTNREISRIFGMSESNVGTILYRVVGKIRLEMEVQHER